MPTPAKHPGSVALTRGIRVEVDPSFRPEHSAPELGRYVFGYRIRVTNEGDRAARLVSRRWMIVDADGEGHEVEGEGVVGQQPELEPGESFTYSSYCPLGTPWGTMEGTYTMLAEDGELFDVRIARFYLVHPGGEDGPGA